MSLSNQNPFPSSQVCVMNLEVISSLLVTHWVWFAINTLKVRAYLILWLIICTLLCPSLHEIFPGISNFLKEISSLQHSIVFLYFFALITEEGFLIPLPLLFFGTLHSNGYETQVQSLGWEDPLEKEMATHSSTLAWKIPWTEEPDRLQSTWSQRVGHD